MFVVLETISITVVDIASVAIIGATVTIAGNIAVAGITVARIVVVETTIIGIADVETTVNTGVSWSTTLVVVIMVVGDSLHPRY